MTQLQGFVRPDGRAGARNQVFILPSVVCSALVARQIADAVGATSVSHQDGCGHIGADIVQTRSLFVGLATNPNVAQSMVVSLGCETVQGAQIAAEIERRSHDTRFVSIQHSGGNDLARETGIAVARELIDSADPVERSEVSATELTIGIAVSRVDERIAGLVETAGASGARVVLAGYVAPADGLAHETIAVGETATAGISVVRDAGAGAQLLAALASCGAQVLIEFSSEQQPPQGFPLAPVISVASGGGLHVAIAGDFDIGAEGTVPELWTRVTEVFSGAETKAELRGSTSFAIPRLLRTM